MRLSGGWVENELATPTGHPSPFPDLLNLWPCDVFASLGAVCATSLPYACFRIIPEGKWPTGKTGRPLSSDAGFYIQPLHLQKYKVVRHA